MTPSGMFSLNLSDWEKALCMAVLGGFALPVLAAIQSPGFSVTTVNWEGVLILAANGALVAGATYLVKNYFSDESGRVFGKIG